MQVGNNDRFMLKTKEFLLIIPVGGINLVHT